MKTRHIFLFLGILLMAFGITLQATAQPTYTSRIFNPGECRQIENYDSGYIIYSNTKWLYKTNFLGDTLKCKQFRGPKQGNYTPAYFYKTSDNQLVLSGLFKPDTSTNNYFFICKLNQNLDTIWVKHHYEFKPNYSIRQVHYEDTLAVAFQNYYGANLGIATFDGYGNLGTLNYFPKYSGAISMFLNDMGAISGKKYLVSMARYFKNPLDQLYYFGGVIYVIDDSQYLCFPSGLSYLVGEGDIKSRVFYNPQGKISLIQFSVFHPWSCSITLYKYDLAGNFLESKHIHGDYNLNEHVCGNNAFMFDNGDLIFLSQYSTSNGSSFPAVEIIRTDSIGQPKWIRRFETDTLGGILVSAKEADNHFMAFVGKNGGNEWLLVVDSLGCEAPGVCWVGEEENSTLPQENLLEIFPNPAGEEVWVKSAAPLAGLTIYAMNGQKMPMAALSGENPMRIDTRTWPSGLYVVRARLQSDRVLTQKFVKLRNP